MMNVFTHVVEPSQIYSCNEAIPELKIEEFPSLVFHALFVVTLVTNLVCVDFSGT